VKAFVTGGGGFLGRRIVELLRERGDDVTSYSRARHEALESIGVRCVQGDVADGRAVREAMQGADVVFHVAARTGVWGPAAPYERTNVLGTRTVVAAAQENGVRALVHTSSPSVCFDGQDHVFASNDVPLATRFLCAYPRTKAHAELIVLGANGKSGLATCALRPHLVFGPGDPHLLPRIIARARAGKLRIVGDGTNKVSLTYVDNAARAHMHAADRLTLAAHHAGRAYFISQEEPVVLWSWIAQVLERLSIEPPRRKVPARVAYWAGAAAEGLWLALDLRGEPPMTRFVALQLARTHTYDPRPAWRDFGYEELVKMTEATDRTVAWLAGQTAGGGGSAGTAGST
jgi:nucleoside-diphosphate-sugar epimerase